MTKSSMQVKKTDFSTESTVLNTVDWNRDGETTPVYAIVSAVAEVEKSDPNELPPLYDVIDPEALNKLFTSRSESSVETVSFQYAGYDIVVRGTNEVQVQAASEV
ncbi:HalOD1 output domain-containing protein [Natrialbaceae archaeon A-arb3/5]